MIEQNPVALLQTLLRFDTTNPPGNEAACIGYIDGLLRAYGLQTTLLEKVPGRPNLIARLPGRGSAPPLLLQGHVDVVPVTGQKWRHPPFAGTLQNGIVYGRGAVDMKSGVAMLLSSVLRLKAQDVQPAGDLILCILSDEEDGGTVGAQFLVDEHPQLFENVRYDIGEFGAFPSWIGGVKFYPIQVSERIGVRLRVIIRGEGGHAAVKASSDTMARLGQVLTNLERRRMPIRVTPVVDQMLATLAAHTRPPTSWIMQGLRRPRLAARLVRLLPQQLGALEPLLRHTANPTIVRGGDKINVIPAEIELRLDGRMLPGFTLQSFLADLRRSIGDDVEIEPMTTPHKLPLTPDMGLYPLLADCLQQADPSGQPIPYMLPAVTDARHFSRLGIQHYGYLPLDLPPGISPIQLAHAADERVPAAAVEFGANVLQQVLLRYGG